MDGNDSRTNWRTSREPAQAVEPFRIWFCLCSISRESLPYFSPARPMISMIRVNLKSGVQQGMEKSVVFGCNITTAQTRIRKAVLYVLRCVFVVDAAMAMPVLLFGRYYCRRNACSLDGPPYPRQQTIQSASQSSNLQRSPVSNFRSIGSVIISRKRTTYTKYLVHIFFPQREEGPPFDVQSASAAVI